MNGVRTWYSSCFGCSPKRATPSCGEGTIRIHVWLQPFRGALRCLLALALKESYHVIDTFQSWLLLLGVPLTHPRLVLS